MFPSREEDRYLSCPGQGAGRLMAPSGAQADRSAHKHFGRADVSLCWDSSAEIKPTTCPASTGAVPVTPVRGQEGQLQT